MICVIFKYYGTSIIIAKITGTKGLGSWPSDRQRLGVRRMLGSEATRWTSTVLSTGSGSSFMRAMGTRPHGRSQIFPLWQAWSFQRAPPLGCSQTDFLTTHASQELRWWCFGKALFEVEGNAGVGKGRHYHWPQRYCCRCAGGTTPCWPLPVAGKFVLLVLTYVWVEDWPERGSESNALIRFPGTPGTSALCALLKRRRAISPGYLADVAVAGH